MLILTYAMVIVFTTIIAGNITFISRQVIELYSMATIDKMNLNIAMDAQLYFGQRIVDI